MEGQRQKKTYMYMLSIALCVFINLTASCGNNRQKCDNTLSLDTVKIQRCQNGDTVTIDAVIPHDTNTELCKSFMNVIKEVFGSYNIEYDNPKNVLSACTDSTYNKFVRDSIENIILEHSIVKVYETDNLVSFVFSHYSNTANSYYIDDRSIGVTFRKDNGQRIDMLSLMKGNFFSKEWQDYIKLQLKRYWEIPTANEMSNLFTAIGRENVPENVLLQLSNSMLSDKLTELNGIGNFAGRTEEYDVGENNIPIPKDGLYFTMDGLMFCYDIGELCHPTEGCPAFCMPYSVLEDFLNENGKQLIMCK